MDGVVEVITGQERRRRWSTSFKLRVVAETQEPGAQVRAVAARHAVCESLVSTWRRQIEIELGDGRRLRVDADVNLAALKRVLAALRG